MKNKIYTKEKELLKEAFTADPERMKKVKIDTDFISKAYEKEILNYTAIAFEKIVEVFKSGTPQDLLTLVYALTGATFTEGYNAKEKENKKEIKKNES